MPTPTGGFRLPPDPRETCKSPTAGLEGVLVEMDPEQGGGDPTGPGAARPECRQSDGSGLSRRENKRRRAEPARRSGVG